VSYLRAIAVLAAVVFATSGCSAKVTQFIVATRNQQGDLAYERGNLADAASAYRLALRLAPNDAHARAGMAAVQLKNAATLYTASKFDDALAALSIAAKYYPHSERLAELQGEIASARLKREIVVSNYPVYRETGLALRRAYAQLRRQSSAIVSTLQLFDYTFDSVQLTKAIQQSYELNAEVKRLTARLTNYRQLVESGAPEHEAQAPLAPAASLLPLP
jgi:tetratricopeptide (TPR) repeat protein